MTKHVPALGRSHSISDQAATQVAPTTRRGFLAQAGAAIAGAGVGAGAIPAAASRVDDPIFAVIERPTAPKAVAS